jgi:prepilin-type N-terminal cleavage/methylation domain-containing protein
MKNRGFTLAEVLITLGIIGIVAALTIPSLINKCQKIVWAKQAQETYAILTQAFKRVLADNDVELLSETPMWTKLYGHDTFSGWSCDTSLEFYSELGKYIKLSVGNSQKNPTVYENDAKTLELSNHPSCRVYLPNGAYLLNWLVWREPCVQTTEECAKIQSYGGNMCSRALRIYLDVNGDNLPNVVGRDIFEFEFSNEGVLYPIGGKDYAQSFGGRDLSTNARYWRRIYDGDSKYNASLEGYERTGQLMEEGWEMNY